MHRAKFFCANRMTGRSIDAWKSDTRKRARLPSALLRNNIIMLALLLPYHT